MTKTRVGFVGVGSMGQCAHLRNYVTVPDCEVVALAELRPVLGRKVAEKYGIPHAYESAEEMLASESLDAIVAAQPFTRHGQIVPALLQTGVPIFTEKPLAGSVQVGKRIVEAVAASGTWHMVGYHKRSDPATMVAKAEIERLVASGELGDLRYVRITMPAGDWVAAGFNELIRTDEELPKLTFDPAPADMSTEAYQQYVAFVNYYIHQVNLMRHLLGEDYTVAYVDRSDVVMTVRSESGVAGIIEMSPYRTTIAWEESALVAFERGYLKLDLPAPLALNRPGRVEIMRDPGDGETPMTEVPTLPWVHAMRQQAMNFVAAVRGEMAPMCQADEALKDLLVAEEYMQRLAEARSS